jgi:inner membrane transporter RhtA
MLSSVLPYSFELIALRRNETRVFGVQMSLEPAVAAAAGLVELGGMALVVLASAMVLVSDRGAQKPSFAATAEIAEIG